MKIAIIMVFFSTIMVYGCKGQTNDKFIDKNEKNNPKVDIKVNKEYDKDGNMVRYDSVYSSYYSSFKGDSVYADSIMDQFGIFFNNSYPNIMNHHFDNLFNEDSVWREEFFNEDFFSKNFKNRNKIFEDMFQEFDSLKNSFFMY